MEAEKFQMEHTWIGDSEVSERLEPDGLRSLAPAALQHRSSGAENSIRGAGGGTCYS